MILTETKKALWSRRQRIYVVAIKRCFDFFVGLIALPFVLLIIAAVAPFIYFEDKGPVFYNAKRIGQNGKLFKMYKFRSMMVNAPDIRTESGDTYNAEDDPRVTKIGRFLRKTSIDEIPQFLNVLVGNMSLIGPRPDPPDWLERYSDDEKTLLCVKPGITGYSQAYYRNSIEAKVKIANDVYYAQNCSLAIDIRILFKTISSVLKRDNIYRN